MATKQQIYEAITREREYQDRQWGTVTEHPHEVCAWLMIMRSTLQKAEQKWLEGSYYNCLREILQVVAVGVAAMEQHDISERRLP